MSLQLIKPEWNAPANIAACCTTRLGGYSQSPYDSLNLGIRTSDNPDQVRANRQLLRQQLALPVEPAWLTQTHSTDVVVLEKTSNRQADAAVSRSPGQVAVVLTADCLPVLLASVSGDEIAAAHAGWRGLQAGVIEATVGKMQNNPQQLLAWIGPGISQAHFEVGNEVREAFVESMPASSACFVTGKPGHWYCDLPGIAELKLRQLGIQQVVRDAHCSYADRELFHSYRRDGESGRMASLIWFQP